MSETPEPAPARTPRAESFAEAERALLARWPETKLEPSLDRIAALTELLGDPQHAYPVVHLTGTNGKTSTSRMIDTLVRATGLRTGRFTSPHVQSMVERICVDGEALTRERFLAAYNDIAPFLDLVERDPAIDHPVSFFETVVAMAFSSFADAPVDVAVVEVGMGGSWDATNVADATVAVVTPIGIDHARYLGDSPEVIAVEKAGIIKPGSTVVVAEQQPEVARVLAERAAEVGAHVVVEGIDFGVQHRVAAVGGQMMSLRGLRAEYDEVFLPLFGAHQASNAALALAAVESFLGEEPLDAELVREAFAQMTSPGRLEVVRRSPTIVLDAAHNPHGANALAEALEDSFDFNPLVAVVGVMADKDYEGVLAALEPVVSQIVCTQNSTPRAMPAEELAEVAEGIFGVDRVHLAPRLVDAIDQAAGLAEAEGVYGSGGVLVTGSVITIGEARTLLVRGDDR
ncbi:MAG: folylpolyglutamate synthase/dihydrofolate synthase family protein [Nocardioides sp.]